MLIEKLLFKLGFVRKNNLGFERLIASLVRHNREHAVAIVDDTNLLRPSSHAKKGLMKHSKSMMKIRNMENRKIPL